jgi:DMSO reductase anchor subunit
MLTLTQLAAGIALLALPLEGALGAAHAPRVASALAVATCAGTGVVASLFHLGRPWLAHRAVLGLRTSWLSREAVALGMFALLATAYAAAFVPGAPTLGGAWVMALQLSTLLTALVGVWCSVMVYAATRRAHWAMHQTGLRFFVGTLLLGAAALLVLDRCGAWLLGAPGIEPTTTVLTALVVLASAARLAHARLSRGPTSTPGSARATGRALQRWVGVRNGAWLLGATHAALSQLPATSSARLLGSALGFAVVLSAELLDRCLFFAAAPSARLPGSVR